MSEEQKELTEEEAALKAQMEELEERVMFLQSIYDTTSIGMIQFMCEKGNALVLSANNAAYMLSKYSKAEFAKKLNNDFLQLIDEEDRDTFMDMLTELTVNGKPEKINIRITTYDNQKIWVDMSVACQVNPKGITIFQAEFFDNTEYALKEKELREQLEKKNDESMAVTKQAQETMDRMLYRDKLTKLHNYEGFLEEAKKLLAERKADACYAVLCTDINNFSKVNEHLGTQAADTLLVDFAKQLLMYEEVLLAARRYGGSFISVIKASSKAEVTNIVKEGTKEFAAGQKEQHPSCDLFLSNGLYILKEEDTECEAAVSKAWYAKNQVRGKKGVICSAYSDLMHMQRMQELDTVEKVKESLDMEHIEVYLQPKFNIQNGKMLGAEAFATWRDDEGVCHSASEFIQALEDEGKSGIVDYTVYEKVCQSMQSWREQGKAVMPISVNFSKIHSYDEQFVGKMNEIADAYNIDKSMIEIEFPEEAFSEAGDSLYVKLEQLRKDGFMVHMDDFGGGKSSLDVLLMAPADTVKLSMGLVSAAVGSEKDLSYLNRICGMIQQLGMDIIFRGVETKEQGEMLSELQYAGRAQGYFYEEPLKAAEFEEKYVEMEKKVEGIFNIVGM